MKPAAIIRGSLLAAALGVVAAPVFLDPMRNWLETRIPASGALLAVVTVAAYAVLSPGGALLRPRPDGFRLGRIDAVLLVALPLYAVSTSNGRFFSSGDNLATRNLGPLIVTQQTFDLSGVAEFREYPRHYSTRWVGNRLLPSFPIGTGLLSVPYSAASLALSEGQVTRQLLDRSEKHLAAVLCAASALAIFFGIRRRFGEGPAFGAAFVFGVATSALTTASQALWSATGAIFCLSATLWCVLPGSDSDARSTAGGLAAAAAFLCRPTALLPAAFIGLALLLTRRRAAVVYGVAAAVGCAVAAAFLFHLYGHPLGGYGVMDLESGAWSAHPAEGFLGNLFSPSRGLLVFFPYVLALPLARPALSRDRELTCWFWASAGAVLSLYALTSLFAKWWGGYSLGPRLLTEVSPLIAFLTVPVWAGLSGRGWARAIVFATVCFAGATQVLAIHRRDAVDWNDDVHVDANRNALWQFRQSQLLAIWWPGALRGPAELSRIVKGHRPDDLLTGGLDTLPNDGFIQGRLVVKGWARIPGEDLDVRVLIDGDERVPGPAARYSRPDVCRALPQMGDCATAGFEVRVDFRRGDEGRHEITAIFLSRDSRYRIYPLIPFTWTP